MDDATAFSETLEDDLFPESQSADALFSSAAWLPPTVACAGGAAGDSYFVTSSAHQNDGEVEIIPITPPSKAIDETAEIATPPLLQSSSSRKRRRISDSDVGRMSEASTSCVNRSRRSTTRLSELQSGCAMPLVVSEARRVLLFGASQSDDVHMQMDHGTHVELGRNSAPLGTQCFVDRHTSKVLLPTTTPAAEGPLPSASESTNVAPAMSWKPVVSTDTTQTPTAMRIAQQWCPWRCSRDSPWTLEEWGLPKEVADVYAEKCGVRRLFPWQRACLFAYFRSLADHLERSAVALLSGGNTETPKRPGSAEMGSGMESRGGSGALLYSAPTSGGKTLVAEVILLRRLLGGFRSHTTTATGTAVSREDATRRKALFIVPYVSIAEEKAAALTTILEKVGARVRLHAGQRGQRSLSEDVHVCTPEKANVLINILIEKQRVHELCAVVVDEVHHIGSDDGAGRGYLLEVLITKLVVLAKQSAGAMSLVALSATLSNSEALAKWMNDAQLFITDFRPVPLHEHVVCKGEVLSAAGAIGGGGRRERLLPATTTEEHDRAENKPYLCLALEQLADDAQVLLFCPSRAQCEIVCGELVKLLEEDSAQHTTGDDNGRIRRGTRLTAAAALRRDIARQLTRVGEVAVPDAQRNTSSTSVTTLSRAILHGVAFHHAALTHEDRQHVEGAFRCGAVWALCCTTTLATGVNLPARCVIFTAPRIAASFLDVGRYKQAAGRAGRMGLDTFGEAYLCCRPQERSACLKLLSTALPPVTSNFSSERRGMMRVLLEGIASRAVKSVDDIEGVIRRTLLAATTEYGVVFHATKEALEFLENYRFVEWLVEEAEFRATLLGQATVASSLAPDEALVAVGCLEAVRKHLLLTNDLQLVFLCTPLYHGMEPDWPRFLSMFTSLPHEMQLAASIMGCHEGYLVQASSMPPHRQSLQHDALTHRRLYATLILLDAIQERPMSETLQKYAPLQRQELQKLMESAATMASTVATFCETLNWWQLVPLLQCMASRLQRGVEPELVPLMRIPGLAPWRARELFKRGFRTPLSVAAALPQELEGALRVKEPFRSSVGGKAGVVQAADDSAGSLHELIAMLQRGARAAVEEEASELLGAISEVKNIVVKSDGVLVQVKEEQRDVVPDQRSVFGDVGLTAREIRCDWIHPSTPPATFDAAKQWLLSCETVSMICLSGLVDVSHPLLVFCGSSPSLERNAAGNDTLERLQRVIFWDDGCTTHRSSRGNPDKATDSTTDTAVDDAVQWAKAHRSMRFVVEELLASTSVRKVVVFAKEWLKALVHGGWLDTRCAMYCVQNLSDPCIAEWLLAPEDRLVSTSTADTASLRYEHTVKMIEQVSSRVGFTSMGQRSCKVELTMNDPSSWKAACRAALALFGESHVSESRAVDNLLRLPRAVQHAAQYAVHLTDLMSRLQGRLQESELLSHFDDVEMPISRCLAVMELDGMPFERQTYEQLARLMHRKAQLLEEEAFRVTGRSRWSLTSPKDCAHVLFDVLKLPSLERTFDTKYLPHRGGKRRRERIAKESRSTRASVLKALSALFPECPLPRIISEHRTMVGWLEKFVTPLLDATSTSSLFAMPSNGSIKRTRWDRICPETKTDDSAGFPVEDTFHRRIHGQFFQTATATGRLAMGEPNLQTVPHPILMELPASEVPQEWMKELLVADVATSPGSAGVADLVPRIMTQVPIRLRDAFAAAPGYLLIGADYAQIEARLLAHFSRDENLIAQFTAQDSEHDIFELLAIRMFGIVPHGGECSRVAVSAEQRKQAKTLCYGLLYGKGKSSLADDLEISEDAASNVIARFREAFPVVHTFTVQVAESAQRLGYVKTITGRKRWLPYAASTVDKFRSASSRMAVNTLCQGSAADLVKRAMLRLLALDDLRGPRPVCRLIMQVHDELLFEVDARHARDVASRIQAEMALAGSEFSNVVPFPVSVTIGRSWGRLTAL